MNVSFSRTPGLWWRWVFFAAFGAGLLGPGLAVTAATSGSTSPQLVEWALYPDGCAVPEDGTFVACGDYGTFYFGSGVATTCVDAAGSESPPAYTRPKSNLITPPVEPTARSIEESIPCVGGSCFGFPGGAAGDEPWIAVIDWDTWHGWTTGWSAISMSGLPAHLYALDGEDLTAFLGPGVGDAHVLARLCEVAEAIDRQGVTPPQVANMSFGRYFAEGLDASDSATCDRANLSCQVGGLFDHLAQAGVVLTAAAGNHGQVQFPAAHETVLAVGSIDLALLASNRRIAAAWETTPLAEILLPGYGVCLEVAGGVDREILWPAPPGSSYASSLFAGWLADTLLTWTIADPLEVDWGLSWSGTLGCFVLSEEAPPHCNEAANRLLERALGASMETCWISSPRDFLEVDSLGVPAQQGVTEGLPSFAEWAEIEHAPAPESDPCVPCVADGFDDNPLVSPQGPQMRRVNLDLVLDLSASSAIQASLTIEELYLRVADNFYSLLDRSVPEHLARLDSLALGEAGGLLVRDAHLLFQPDQQPSLLFVLCEDTAGCFWSSIPILAVE